MNVVDCAEICCNYLELKIAVFCFSCKNHCTLNQNMIVLSHYYIRAIWLYKPSPENIFCKMRVTLLRSYENLIWKGNKRIHCELHNVGHQKLMCKWRFHMSKVNILWVWTTSKVWRWEMEPMRFIILLLQYIFLLFQTFGAL